MCSLHSDHRSCQTKPRHDKSSAVPTEQKSKYSEVKRLIQSSQLHPAVQQSAWLRRKTKWQSYYFALWHDMLQLLSWRQTTMKVILHLTWGLLFINNYISNPIWLYSTLRPSSYSDHHISILCVYWKHHKLPMARSKCEELFSDRKVIRLWACEPAKMIVVILGFMTTFKQHFW